MLVAHDWQDPAPGAEQHWTQRAQSAFSVPSQAVDPACVQTPASFCAPVLIAGDTEQPTVTRPMFRTTQNALFMAVTLFLFELISAQPEARAGFTR
jgi:hypothetical protein